MQHDMIAIQRTRETFYKAPVNSTYVLSQVRRPYMWDLTYITRLTTYNKPIPVVLSLIEINYFTVPNYDP